MLDHDEKPFCVTIHDVSAKIKRRQMLIWLANILRPPNLINKLNTWCKELTFGHVSIPGQFLAISGGVIDSGRHVISTAWHATPSTGTSNYSKHSPYSRSSRDQINNFGVHYVENVYKSSTESWLGQHNNNRELLSFLFLAGVLQDTRHLLWHRLITLTDRVAVFSQIWATLQRDWLISNIINDVFTNMFEIYR